MTNIDASGAAAGESAALPNDFEELAHANDLRAEQYAALARLFRVEVDQELLDRLRAAHFPAKSGNAKVDAGNRAIAAYLGSLHTDVLTELAVDYVHAFVGAGVGGHEAAYPFESAYTSEKRLLMQGARDEVRALYRAYDLDRDASWHEGEDHVALELEFMGTLAGRTAAVLRTGDEDGAASLLAAQRNFLADHLGVWAPGFAADVRHFARTDFYRGAADLLEGTLEVDAAFLDDVLGAGDGAETTA